MPSRDAAPQAGRHQALVARLYRQSGASAWDLDEATFSAAIARIACHRLGDGWGDDPGAAEFLHSLHVEDFALVAACLADRQSAWEHLVGVYRPDLRKAGRAIAGDAGADLADSIFAELYGLEERDGQRRSLLLYFHGRSRLSTWLRTVLAQRHVDQVRAARRLDPLDEEAAVKRPGSDPRRQDAPEPKHDRLVALFRLALAAAIAALDPAPRQRLAFYHGQRLTLAQIGRLFHEHEATVSRKLDRARRDLRVAVERELRQRHHLADAEVERAVELGVPEAGDDIARLFAGVEPPARGVLTAARAPSPGTPAESARAATAAADVPPTPQGRKSETFQEWSGS